MTVFPNLWRNRPLFPAARRRDALTRLFDEFFEPTSDGIGETTPSDFLPPLNVAEDQKTLTITVELPGFDEKDVHVSVTGNLLTVSGERKWEETKKGKEWHRVESRFGSFSRSLALPENLKMDQVDAVFSKGVLTLAFPKVEATPTTKVKVKTQ